MKKNQSGFIGLLGLILILIVLAAIVGAGYTVLQRGSKSKSSNVASTEANSFIDTPECAAFNTYVNDQMGLPDNFQLEMRAYVRCGNFFSFDTGQQVVVYGYKINKAFQDKFALHDYVNSSLEKIGWKKVDGNDTYIRLTSANLNGAVKIIAYSPATIEIRVTSTADYHKYSTAKQPSPPQKLLNTGQQVKSSPFGVYVPTVFPHLQSNPAYKAEDLSASPDHGQYLYIIYYANGLLIGYSSTQTGTAEDNCKLASGHTCTPWATTPKGNKLYVRSISANKEYLKDVIGLEVDIDGTNLSISGGSDIPISKEQLIQIVDSMQKVN